jgi:hypothetical protein
MKSLLSVALGLALCTAGAGATRAAEPEDAHKGHHPAPAAVTSPTAVAPAPTTPVANQAPAASASPMAKDKVDAQLERMHEMHDRMAKATTPAERKALMTEHMQAMQDGMKMMHQMSMPPMDGNETEGGMPMGAMTGGDASGGMPHAMGEGMKAHHDAMHKRMQMMEAMMQMMMDRLAEPAASN